MKKVAIVQSNYIPWKGYFDLIAAVDEFILYDDMQFTRRDWRNRNKIKTQQETMWLTVPVKSKGLYTQAIKDTAIIDTIWTENHWKIIKQNYSQAPHFDSIASWLEPLYLNNTYTNLSKLNKKFIKRICDYLEINTIISSSDTYSLVDGKTERLANLCKQAGGSIYFSGPSAKEYVEEECFKLYEIQVKWFEYNNYPEYPQLGGSFEHNVSILDLLFNCGKESYKYMKFVK